MHLAKSNFFYELLSTSMLLTNKTLSLAHSSNLFIQLSPTTYLKVILQAMRMYNHSWKPMRFKNLSKRCRQAEDCDPRVACMEHVNLLCLSGHRFQFMRFKVENVVAAVHCPFRPNLKETCEQVFGWVNYEPTIFLGLIFRKVLNGRKTSNKHNTLVFICFQNGKCIITDGHPRAQILSEWIQLLSLTMSWLLSNNVARFDYGSSGNYRMAQNALAYDVKDLEMFKNICYFQCKHCPGLV